MQRNNFNELKLPHEKPNLSYATVFANFFLFLCCFFAIYFVMFSVKYTIREVSGASMQPTLNNTTDPLTKFDVVIASKLDNPQFLDIVIANDKTHGPIIKRVIGLSGDRIKIEEIEFQKYAIKRNGKLLNEPYLKPTETMKQTYENLNEYRANLTPEEERKLFNENGEFIVPENHYFLLGDNRSNSTDSSILGAVSKNNLEAVVTNVIPYGKSLTEFLIKYFLGFHIKW